MHNHSHCIHDLKYCEHCDVVYCTKCSREWSGHTHRSYTWYYYNTPYTVRWVDDRYTLTNINSNTVVNDKSVLDSFTTYLATQEEKPSYRDVIGVNTICSHK